MRADYKPKPKMYGYERVAHVPAGGNPRVCRTCNLWFAARPREVACDGCIPAWKRVKRLTRATSPGSTVDGYRPQGQRGYRSDFLGVLFRSGISQVRVLAFEAAAWLDANPLIRSSRPPWDGARHLYRDRAPGSPEDFRPSGTISDRVPASQKAVTDIQDAEIAAMAARTERAIEWKKASGKSLSLYHGYGQMSGREVSVAIGWVPWPAAWPVPD